MEPLDYLALESNACCLLKSRKYFLNQISDVQEKRMSNDIIHVSPGSFLKSIVYESVLVAQSCPTGVTIILGTSTVS